MKGLVEQQNFLDELRKRLRQSGVTDHLQRDYIIRFIEPVLEREAASRLSSPDPPVDLMDALHNIFTKYGIASRTQTYLVTDVIHWAAQAMRQSGLSSPEGTQLDLSHLPESSGSAPALEVGEWKSSAPAATPAQGRDVGQLIQRLERKKRSHEANRYKWREGTTQRNFHWESVELLRETVAVLRTLADASPGVSAATTDVPSAVSRVSAVRSRFSAAERGLKEVSPGLYEAAERPAPWQPIVQKIRDLAYWHAGDDQSSLRTRLATIGVAAKDLLESEPAAPRPGREETSK